MNNFVIFIVGIAVTLIAGMGVITSQVFVAYKKDMKMELPDSKIPCFYNEK